MKFPRRRHVSLFSLLLVSAGLLSTGCGGGAGGAGGGIAPFIAPAPAPKDSQVTQPAAVSRAFAPNYSPVLKSDGIWPGRTVRVYFPPESEHIVGEALIRWSDATGKFFRWDRVGSPGEAQVVFQSAQPGELEPGAVGRTTYSYTPERKELTSAHVHYAVTGSETDQARVVVHEIGHALGIHGHSDGDSDVMYPTVTERNAITERDLNTLFWLYRNTAASGRATADGTELTDAPSTEATNSLSCEGHGH